MTLADVYNADEIETKDHLLRILDDLPIFDDIYFAMLPGAPTPKGRPRSTMGGKHYTPEATVVAEALMANKLHKACRTPLEGPVALACVFYVPDLRLADADNLTKLVLDAGNCGTKRNPNPSGVWKDDKQVVRLAAFMEYAPENPRTLVAWCEVESLLIGGCRHPFESAYQPSVAMPEQLALPFVVPEIRGGKARAAAGLCVVNTCAYKPVQVDRWGYIFCELHRWRDDEMIAEGEIIPCGPFRNTLRLPTL